MQQFKVAWCPPFVSLGLCGVMVPLGELTARAWKDALEDRINAMVLKEPDPLWAASQAAKALGMPGVEHEYETGEVLFRHNLELQTVLSLAMNSWSDPFPAKVKMSARAEAVQYEMDETDFWLWVNLAAAQMNPHDLD